MRFSRYPEYKPSGVEWLGDIPAHWRISKLKHSATFTSGGTPSKSVPGYWGGNVPWASSRDLKVETLTDTTEHITEQAVADGAQIVEPGHLLVVVRGMILAHSFPVAKALVPMAINQDLKAIRPVRDWQVDYFAALLRAAAPETLRRLDEAGHGTKALRMEAWTGMELPHPPVAEQHAIAEFLDRETAKIDALVAEQERLIELLKEKRRALISHAVTKGLNPDAPMKDSGIEWLGDIPAHWQPRRLKHLSPAITVGIVVNPSEYIAEEGLPFIYGGDVREGSIDWQNARRITAEHSGANEKTRLRKGDLITVRVGAPGVTAVVPPECDGGNCASVMLTRRGAFDPDWLCFVMNDRVVRAQVEVVQYGAAQEQFNISHAVNFWVPVPPAHEQRSIAEALQRETRQIDGLIRGCKRAMALLQERRTALISAAVTGQIDVRGVAASRAA